MLALLSHTAVFSFNGASSITIILTGEIQRTIGQEPPTISFICWTENSTTTSSSKSSMDQLTSKLGNQCRRFSAGWRKQTKVSNCKSRKSTQGNSGICVFFQQCGKKFW